MSLAASPQAMRVATGSTAAICPTDLYLSYSRSRFSANPCAQGWPTRRSDCPERWQHRIHGDCHGYHAHIALQGPRAGQVVFFDFESGPGYLAYDVSVFLWNCVLFGRKDHASWHAFMEGYRSIRELSHADFEAAHLFIPIRHMWLLGEYASRIPEWDRQAVPADWIAERLDFRLSWEKEKLIPGLL
jgi:Ser/Thr protein kinase RdoA (MazF antagonist)